MKSDKKIVSVVLALGFLLYSIIMFLVPLNRDSVFWTVYIFTAVAFGVQKLTVDRVVKSGAKLKNIFTGIPILYIGAVYLIAQIVFGFAMVVVPNTPVWLNIVISAGLLVISAVLLLSVDKGRDYIEDMELQIQNKVQFIQGIKIELEGLKAEDAGVQNKMKKLLDVVTYSDPISNEAVEVLEREIKESFEALKTALNKNDYSVAEHLTEALIIQFDQRNKKTKLMK